MKKSLLLFVALFFSLSFKLNAQETFGYTDIDDFRYVLDYRLPDWGYSNFFISSIGLNSEGNYRFVDFDNTNPLTDDFETNRSNQSVAIGISPRYELYRESEVRRLSFEMNSGIFTGYSISKEDDKVGTTDTERDRQTNDQNFSYSLDLNTNSYFEENAFFIANLLTDIQFLRAYSKSGVDQSTVNDQINTARFISFNPTLGIGIGRIRNVTPLIRALRLNERYKALGNTSFTDSEILSSATAFTKIQGYQRSRDRFLKDFWGDINSGVNNKLDQLNTFDLFYLNDVFDENLGSRFEGYEVSFSVDYLYFNQLQREADRFNDSKDRELTINREANVDLNFDWFKNLDLYNQISVNAQNQLIFPLEKANNEKWGNATSLNAEWLWNFADRFQLTTSLLNSLFKIRFKDDTVDDFINFNSQLRSNLFYFVENKLALNAGASLRYGRINRGFDTFKSFDEQFRWSINAGVSYYFNRNLY